MKLLTLSLLTACAFAGSAWSQTTNADNTANNKNDTSNLTAGDQSNDPADIKTTSEIRKMVVADDSLSMLAKNVKIITVDGVVTLRGPVKTEKEKATIEMHAKQVKPKSVVNEISLKQ